VRGKIWRRRGSGHVVRVDLRLWNYGVNILSYFHGSMSIPAQLSSGEISHLSLCSLRHVGPCLAYAVERHRDL